MSTQFSELYDPTRLLLGDTNAAAPGYTTAQLDLALGTVLLGDDTYSEGTPTPPATGRVIEPTVATKQDKLRLSAKSALALITPQTAVRSYRTRVLSVTRDWSSLIDALTTMVNELEDGSYVVSEDEWDRFLAGPQDMISRFSGYPAG